VVKNKITYLILFLPLFITHLYLSHANNIPFIYNDEAGYIGKARYFVDGYLPFTLGMYKEGNFVNISYYPGYSFLLSPLFLISNNIEIIYKIIQLVNSLLMALIPVLAYRISRYLADDLPYKYHLVTALTIGCYPPFLLHSNVAWSEALFIPLFLFLCLQIFHLSNNPGKPIFWISSNFSFAFLLSTHPRAFGVLPALLITFLVVANDLLKKSSRKYIITALAFASLLTVSLVLYTVARTGGGYQANVQVQLLKTLSLSGFLSLLTSANNKLFYITLASLGIAILGIFRSFHIIRNFRDDRRIYPLTLFSLLSFIFVLLLSSMMMSRTDGRADHIIYGRYIEGVIAPIFVLGFIEYFKKGYGVRFAIATCFIIVFTYVSASRYLESLPMNLVNIMGICNYRFFTGNFSFKTVMVIFAVSLAIVMATRYCSLTLSVIAVGLIFLISSAYIAQDYFARSVHSMSESLELLTPLKRYVASGNGRILSFDKSYLNMQTIGHVYVYPIHVPELGISFFNSNKGKVAQSEIFINGSFHAPDWGRDARLIGLENKFPQYLWLLPGKAQDQFIQEGCILPKNFPAPLPDSALCASMALQKHEIEIKDGKVVVPLSVRHAGEGFFWPNASDFKRSSFSVGVGVRLFSRKKMSIVYADVFDLPHSVYPGQSITMDLPLEFSRDSVPPGEYLLRIDLVQQGVRLFSEIQDTGLNLPVNLSDKRLVIGDNCPFLGNPLLISHYVPENGRILPQHVLVKENIYKDNNWTNGEGILKCIHYEIKPDDNFLVIETNGFNPFKGNMQRIGLQVAANGIKLEYFVSKNNQYYFKLPKKLKVITALSLKSRTFVPKKQGINNDKRKLGIDIKAIRFSKEVHA